MCIRKQSSFDCTTFFTNKTKTIRITVFCHHQIIKKLFSRWCVCLYILFCYKTKENFANNQWCHPAGSAKPVVKFRIVRLTGYLLQSVIRVLVHTEIFWTETVRVSQFNSMRMAQANLLQAGGLNVHAAWREFLHAMWRFFSKWLWFASTVINRVRVVC